MTITLALATLGILPQTESFLFVLCHPRWHGPVMDHLHWQTLRDNAAIMQATATLIVLVLATLGDATQIGLFLLMSLCPG
jgi:hypothetical protein